MAFMFITKLTYHDNCESECLRLWSQKYGALYGFYKGHTPFICTSDVDLLQEVFVRQFSKFHSRKPLQLDERQSEYVHIVHAEGYRWKRQRMAVNPAFSKLKMKSLEGLMYECIGTFLDKISEQSDSQPFDILPYFKRLTMDVIWTCGFGVKTNMQSDHNNEFLKYSNEVFEIDDNKRILAYFSILIPELHGVFRYIHRKLNEIKYFLHEYTPLSNYLHIKQDPIIWITNKTHDIIMKRLEQENTEDAPNDLLQILLDSMSKDPNETKSSEKGFICNMPNF
ncbi:unnamed protein product [Adineta ricciae]|uniref:Cytochrome P450 n=1 Tax=Adineta ricciae TaxID=249248 RepID=A0A816F0H9_ADIRI|nr:unnamed protein product [Adineta ricciae]